MDFGGKTAQRVLKYTRSKFEASVVHLRLNIAKYRTFRSSELPKDNRPTRLPFTCNSRLGSFAAFVWYDRRNFEYFAKH